MKAQISSGKSIQAFASCIILASDIAFNVGTRECVNSFLQSLGAGTTFTEIDDTVVSPEILRTFHDRAGLSNILITAVCGVGHWYIKNHGYFTIPNEEGQAEKFDSDSRRRLKAGLMFSHRALLRIRAFIKCLHTAYHMFGDKLIDIFLSEFP